MRKESIDLIREDRETVLDGTAPSLTPLRGECVLITGGTGFIGTWVAELIAALNDHHEFDTEVILLSSHAHRFAAKAPHLAARKEITILDRDIRGVTDIPPEVGWIIHAAGTPDNRVHSSDPVGTIDVIVNGTASILESAVRLPNLKKFLNVSSGLVIGPQPLTMEVIPEHQYRGVNCSVVSSAYVEAKRLAETLCAAYRSQHRLPIVNVRPFAFIGPYQYLDRPWAVNNFIRDSLLGGAIRILGDGETVRSYMYPSDMSLWILHILLDGRIGETYNVGSPNGVTLRQLAEKVASNFPIRPKILSGLSQDKAHHRTRFVPDVSLAQDQLGLKLTVGLDEAICRAILWHREQTN